MTDRVTLVIVDRGRGRGKKKAHQMSRLAGECCTRAALGKLKDFNLRGWDVYCSVNPTVAGTSRSVRDVRRLQVELDTDGDEKLRALVGGREAGRGSDAVGDRPLVGVEVACPVARGACGVDGGRCRGGEPSARPGVRG